jgi:glyoxylase-like metal-dependent hydrolase (beta-lactamase superfamily II)/ferredoxin
MADPRRRVPENVPGEFFVDATCIDCDTCRQLAPQVFGQASEYSFVHRQPATEAMARDALHALLACPTGSIGTVGGHSPKQAAGDFPLPVEEPVYYCGYTSPDSFGGSSYFLRRESGNWLVDSPKFLPQLVRPLEERGGIEGIFLTHRDDVADADKYARHFGSRRHIHRLELDSQPEAEVVLDGFEPVKLADDLLAIPTPGHTAGHCVLLFRERFLFTGDHLWWDRDRQRLGASRSYCWHSWDEQIESMQRLKAFRFEWVLPGHGQRVHLPADEMQAKLRELVERMRGAPRARAEP